MTTGQPVLFLTNTARRQFAAVIIRSGDTYGADQQLTNTGQPLVEFWDLTHPFDPITAGDTRRGQFTGARYYTATLLADQGLVRGSGLNLHGAVPEWTLSFDVIPPLLAFLQDHDPSEPEYEPCLICGTPFLSDGESPLCEVCRTV